MIPHKWTNEYDEEQVIHTGSYYYVTKYLLITSEK